VEQQKTKPMTFTDVQMKEIRGCIPKLHEHFHTTSEAAAIVAAVKFAFERFVSGDHSSNNSAA